MNPRLFSLQPVADAIKKLGALLVFGACGLFCPLSGSAAAPSQPDALTAASFSSDFPAEHMPLKVGVVKYVRPSPYEPIVEATIGALKRVFGTSNVIVTHYDLRDSRRPFVKERWIFSSQALVFTSAWSATAPARRPP